VRQYHRDITRPIISQVKVKTDFSHLLSFEERKVHPGEVADSCQTPKRDVTVGTFFFAFDETLWAFKLYPSLSHITA
jgi:hypothetical protein